MVSQPKPHDRHNDPPPQVRPLPAVELEIVRGPAVRLCRPVHVPAYLIGAAADCDLVLGDRRFPDVHTYLMRKGDDVSLRHLGVGPELTVNGRRVTRVQLSDGDRIRTGPYEFRVRIDGDVREAGTERHPRQIWAAAGSEAE